MTEAEKQRRIVIGNGIDVDKEFLHEINKRIGRDLDMHRLSLFGPILWNLIVLLPVLWLVVQVILDYTTLIAVVTNSTNVLSTSFVRESTAFIQQKPASASLIVLALAIAYGNFKKIVGNLIDSILGTFWRILEQIGRLGIVFRLETWQNHNYWHAFTSHLSDRDSLAILSNYPSEDIDAVNGVYSDDPYYSNVYVDSVYVEFDDVPWTRELKIDPSDWRWFPNPDWSTSVTVPQLRPLELSLFRQPWRLPRRLLVITAFVLAVVYQFGAPLGLTTVPILRAVPWALFGPISGIFVIGMVLLAFPTKHFRFHSYFYSDSAGNSEYGKLLNETPDQVLRDNEKYQDVSLLANSLCGYGIFYLSEFLRVVVGRNYNYEVQSPFDGRELDLEDPDDKARIAGTNLLESSVPARREGADTVSCRVTGVKYLKVDNEYTSLNPVRFCFDTFRSVLLSEDRPKVAHRETAGSRQGIRLPVKKVVSVPSEHTAESNLAVTGDSELFYDRSWENEEVHYLLLGGAEHQQGLVKFIRQLKREGYKNVDLLENTFASADDFKFTSEYFVSSVIAGKQPFRGDESFIFLRHKLPDTDTYVYVLMGLSALATKLGFLYWIENYPEFQDTGVLEDDIIYQVKYDAPNVPDDEFFDPGKFYQDMSWCRPESDTSLEFDWRGTIGETDDENETGIHVNKGENNLGCRTVKITVEEQD